MSTAKHVASPSEPEWELHAALHLVQLMTEKAGQPFVDAFLKEFLAAETAQPSCTLYRGRHAQKGG